MRLKNRVHPKLVLRWTVAMFDHPELYILRHGETVWNRQGRYQGRKDSPLTEKGRQQAVSQRKLLNAIETLPRKVYVSPLGRTVETAQLAVTFVDHPIADDRLQNLTLVNGKARQNNRSANRPIVLLKMGLGISTAREAKHLR